MVKCFVVTEFNCESFYMVGYGQAPIKENSVVILV